jgi:superfamily II DNA or RNA helicase
MKQTLDYFNKEGGCTFNLSGEPGSGKSVLLSAILAELNTKTLIIAHLSMLTTQLLAEIKAFTNADVKILSAKDSKLADINIATSQFISRHPEIWYKVKKNIGLIAVDEAETIGSETTIRILQRAHAKYRIAVTATFTRSVDGRTPALKDMIGDKVITLVNPKLIKPTIIRVFCRETFKAPLNKNFYKRALASFFTRNRASIEEKIETITSASLKKGRQVLIATDVQDMQNNLAAFFEQQGVTCGIMNSNTKASDRTRILEEYDKGNIKVLLGFGVLNAGLSIPKISTIIRVSTPGNVEKLEQLIGRSRRMYDGKDGAWFIDLTFEGFNSQNRKRYSFYNRKVLEENWEFKSISWENFQKHLTK